MSMIMHSKMAIQGHRRDYLDLTPANSMETFVLKLPRDTLTKENSQASIR